ncbi:MFS transporter [Nocardioides immobilis]|uniref:MFS transporter n=1 Tax=Nocardioides immobilis TaxID=2049295 RepID=UPI0015FAE72A|nr:MFS transporter [Nocardioides immobilis]
MVAPTAVPLSASQPQPEAPTINSALVVTTLSLCGIVVALQQTLLLPLLPLLPRLLDTTADTASWLVTATLLTGAIATPTISRLADMYGKRRMMVIALAVSVLGSLVGALSTALPLLLGARALQGVGMALIPVGIAIMRDELPRERLPLGVALMSATLAIGAGAGPPLSGLIAEHLDWHAIFWLTGVVGILLLLVTLAVLPESPVRTRGTFDVRGAVLLSVALTAVLLVLSKGGQWGWGSPRTLGLGAAGLVLLAVWGPVELRTPNPLVDLRVAGRRAVLLVNAASALSGFAMFANMLLTMLFLQLPTKSGYGLGLDILATGLWMTPNAAAFGLMAPVSALLTRRFGPQVTMLSGAAVMSAAYVGRVFFSDDLAQVVIGAVVVSIGTAMVFGALPMLIMRAVPVTETAAANGLNVLLRTLGTSTASASVAAVAGASIVAVGGQVLPSSQGITLLLWLSAGTALGAALLGIPMLRMRDFEADADRGGTATTGRPSKVVRGQVLSPSSHPISRAVVTILAPDGKQVDWGQADSEGRFRAAIPASADYLVVTAADGWQPRSQLLHLDSEAPLPPIVLRDRLTLTGTITDAEGQAVSNALVVLTRNTGETVLASRSDHDGRYEMPRPANGRYVLTVVAADGAIGARPAPVWEAARSVDLTLGTPLSRPAR